MKTLKMLRQDIPRKPMGKDPILPAYLVIDNVPNANRGQWSEALTKFGSVKHSPSDIDLTVALDQIRAVIGHRTHSSSDNDTLRFFDVLSSIAKSHNDRRPGGSGIPNEFLKQMPYIWKFRLTQLFNDYYSAVQKGTSDGMAPPAWKTLELLAVAKIAAATCLETDFRWLGMQDSIQKIYTRSLGIHSNSSRSTHSTRRSSALVAADVFETIHFADVWDIPLVVCVGDIAAAHDYVRRDVHINGLRTQGHDDAIIVACLEEYSRCDAVLTIPDSATSDRVAYNKGLRQGDPLSSPHFDDIVETIIAPLELSWNSRGSSFILPDSGTRVAYTRVADNIYLFASSVDNAKKMMEDLVYALDQNGFAINLKSRKFLTAGSLIHNNDGLKLWNCNDYEWKKCEEFIVVGVMINNRAQTKRAWEHRKTMTTVALAKYRGHYRRHLNYDVKTLAWQRQGQLGALYAAELMHLSKELIIDIKTWEFKKIANSLNLKCKADEDRFMFRTRRSKIVKQSLARTGIARLHEKVIKAVLRASVSNVFIADAVRRERDMQWRECVKFWPYYQRKAAAVTQARTGRRVAWDDWLYHCYGADWRSLIQNALVSKPKTKALIQQACQYFNVYDVVVQDNELPLPFVQLVDHSVPFSIDTPILELPLPPLHKRDGKILSEWFQIEFITDNENLANVLNGNSCTKQHQQYGIITELVANILMKGWCPRMFALPLFAWRRREWNTLADAMANLAMNLERDVHFTTDEPIVVQRGELLQIHSDGGFRSHCCAAIGCTVALVATRGGHVTRKLIGAHGQYVCNALSPVHTEITAMCLGVRTAREWIHDVVAAQPGPCTPLGTSF